MNFSIILAIDSKNGLGKENALAWKLSGDMKYFKKTTVLTDNPDDINVVIMGRKTWESIPSKFRPLPGRINCVLTRNPPHIPPSQGGGNQGCVYFESLDSCLEEIENMKNVWKVFIIWWAQIYNQVLEDSRLEKIYLTQVKWDFDCDVFFDGIPSTFEQEWSSEAVKEWWIEFQFEVWKQK